MTPPAVPPRAATPLAPRFLALGALLLALGWWLPWLGARSGAAGLVLLGLDLGEFLKFTTPWRAGLIAVERNSFFLPPVLAALLVALALAGTERRTRALAALPLLWLTVVILPQADLVLAVLQGLPGSLDSHSTEFGGQFALALGGALSLLALLAAGPRLPVRGRGALALLLALLGVLPFWALWRLWPLLQGLYGGGALPGSGVAVSALGLLVSALAACRALRFPRE